MHWVDQSEAASHTMRHVLSLPLILFPLGCVSNQHCVDNLSCPWKVGWMRNKGRPSRLILHLKGLILVTITVERTHNSNEAFLPNGLNLSVTLSFIFSFYKKLFGHRCSVNNVLLNKNDRPKDDCTLRRVLLFVFNNNTAWGHSISIISSAHLLSIGISITISISINHQSSIINQQSSSFIHHSSFCIHQSSSVINHKWT